MDNVTRCKPLLDAIRKHEAPKGYGQIYSGAKGVSKSTDVSKMTLNEVLAMQKKMIEAGSASTASGGYQFIRKTLIATMAGMGMKGSEVWTPELQERMATYLIEQRGLNRYLDGMISREFFANNLAKEWASLPVVSTIKGGNRTVTRGQSFYAGDGLNKAFHKPETIEALLDAIKRPVEAPKPSPAPTEPKTDLPVPAKPMGLLAAFIAVLKLIFGRK